MFVFRIDVSITVDQQGGHVERVVIGCNVQRPPAVLVYRIDLCTTIYQCTCHVDPVLFSRTVKILAFKVYFHTIHRFPDDAKLAMHNLNWMVYN